MVNPDDQIESWFFYRKALTITRGSTTSWTDAKQIRNPPGFSYRQVSEHERRPSPYATTKIQFIELSEYRLLQVL